ncbi:MAG: hypothetical protein M3N97_16405 [Pseudomonadota bacterium]|nr:hypothetical protein [Pseudomonadota bacterium]
MNGRPALALAFAALVACTAAPSNPSREIFDEQSASTLLVAGAPLVFARDRSDVAAHARDYATLVAVEIDVSGEYRQYVLLYRWSTVDRRMSPPPRPDDGELVILADGRTIDLLPLPQFPVDLRARRALHIPARDEVVAHAYPVDPATLHYLATSRELTVRMPRERLDTPFRLFEDGRKALVQFLERAATP